ncbi:MULTISPECIES: glycosyltransferase family 4 protein [Nostocales]|uniref:Glycosyltransferase family 4 protein n=3 Tax=Nostocales TaxID=1161 RepID=A0A0C1RL86_9CYAN|nr:glycosyltransferase family 4 protein [Tolypothrix bouteillei]KAF3888364.1 glycosyltransferase family 4 protein [Tolypothrix bouteillei VB521301]
MKILQVHNAYRHMGGEEVVVAAEHEMLKQYGHEIHQWILENSSIENANTLTKAKIALQSIWSTESYSQTRKKLQEFQPDIVHVHNTIPLISPSVFAACQDASVPVVHTLHNYKLICPGAYLYRNAGVCEDCVGKTVPYQGVIHGCYRGSNSQTAVAVAGLTTHRLRGTYKNEVDIYIALTRFARQKFIEAGLPAEKIAVKPNFVTSNIAIGEHTGGYALFVGKLVQYKGIETLLNAWHLLNEAIPLKIVGQGPLEILLKSNLPNNVEYLGRLPREKVVNLMQNASFLIFPSEWYEPFGMVIAEAFATGLPVIASRIGGITEIVKEGYSGWNFTPEDAQDLARTVQLAWSNPAELQRRSVLAREQYEDHYSLEQNYQMIMSIYQTAIAWHKDRQSLTVF